MNLLLGGKPSGKTSAMLYDALKAAGKGEKVIFICVPTRGEINRVRKMAEDLCSPASIPRTLKFTTSLGGGVDLRAPGWPHVRGMLDHKIFIDHRVWDSTRRNT